MRERTWSQILPVICNACCGKLAPLFGLVPVRLSPNYPRISTTSPLNLTKFATFAFPPRQKPPKRPNWRRLAGGKTIAFPHFFPQLWKTSGGDPTLTNRFVAGEATVAHGFVDRQPCHAH